MFARRLFQLWAEAMAPRRYRPGRVGLRRPCGGVWGVGRGRNTVAGNVWASPRRPSAAKPVLRSRGAAMEQHQRCAALHE